jgi:hypothetical protein
MFSHNASENPYWKNPAWYNRDRPLFKRYIPVIREVAEAGWRPVPHATCDNPAILLERFGGGSGSPVHFTLFNDDQETQTGILRVDAEALELAGTRRGATKLGLSARELLSGKTLAFREGGFRLRLGPGEAQALKIYR